LGDAANAAGLHAEVKTAASPAEVEAVAGRSNGAPRQPSETTPEQETTTAKRVVNPIRDIQVLCPMNRGGVGARSLNIELQVALNPAGERKVERFGWTFAPGDKVMQIENDYDKEVYNGDIGYVDAVDPEVGELVASPTGGR
jgi:ATP-dependent exoDNAse (exonuclease V) alpha subunit